MYTIVYYCQKYTYIYSYFSNFIIKKNDNNRLLKIIMDLYGDLINLDSLKANH